MPHQRHVQIRKLIYSVKKEFVPRKKKCESGNRATCQTEICLEELVVNLSSWKILCRNSKNGGAKQINHFTALLVESFICLYV